MFSQLYVHLSSDALRQISYSITKRFYAICENQRRRITYAAKESDHLFYSYLDSSISSNSESLKVTFESWLLGYPENRFYRDVVEI